MPAVRVEPIVALTHEGGGARRKRDPARAGRLQAEASVVGTSGWTVEI